MALSTMLPFTGTPTAGTGTLETFSATTVHSYTEHNLPHAELLANDTALLANDQFLQTEIQTEIDAINAQIVVINAALISLSTTIIQMDGTAYLDTANNTLGYSLKTTVLVLGVPVLRYFPASDRADGVFVCHSNCHGNCHLGNMCHIFVKEEV